MTRGLPKRVLLLTTACLLVLETVGCTRSTDSVEPTDRTEALPQVTADEANVAVADAMLAASTALYLILAKGDDNRLVVSDSGQIEVSWSSDADFSTGVGSYLITLTGFSLSGDDQFQEFYNGYVLTGTMEMASPDGVTTDLLFDLECTHPDGTENPVRSIVIRLDGVVGGADLLPGGEILINGWPMELEDLATSLNL